MVRRDPQPSLAGAGTRIEQQARDGGREDEGETAEWTKQVEAEGSWEAAEALCRYETLNLPRYGPVWVDLTKEQQERIIKERQQQGWELMCEHKAVVGGPHGGRPLIQKATKEGIAATWTTCCCRTKGLTGETRQELRDLEEAGRLPPQIMNVERIGVLLRETAWPDQGLYYRLKKGVVTMYTGDREGIEVFPNAPGMEEGEARQKLDGAFAKDLKGLPGQDGQALSHLWYLGDTLDEALATLFSIPDLAGEAPWIRVCKLAVISKMFCKDRLIDDMSMGTDGVNGKTWTVAVARMLMANHEDLIKEILELQASAPDEDVLGKTVDATSYFRLFRMAMKDLPTVCIRDALGKYYSRLGSPFGGRVFPAVSGSLTSFLVYILRKRGVRTQGYCDDAAMLALRSAILERLDAIINDTYSEFGIPFQMSKVKEWSTQFEWTGYGYDTKAWRRRLSRDRAKRYLAHLGVLIPLLLAGAHITLDDIGPIYHSLLASVFVFRYGRVRLQNMRRLVNQLHAQEGQCTAARGARQERTGGTNRGLRGRTRGLKASALVLEEATHWQGAITRNDGVALDWNVTKKSWKFTFATDASGQAVGGFWEERGEYFQREWTEAELRRIEHWGTKFTRRGEEEVTIAICEFVGLLIGAAIWFRQLQGQSVLIKVDNTNVVAWVNGEWPGSKSPIVIKLLVEWVELCEEWNVDVCLEYINTHDNKHPDALSRSQWSRFHALVAHTTVTRCVIPEVYADGALVGL